MRKANRQRPRLDKVSEHSRYLTPHEVLYARLTLAHDMVGLALREDTAPGLPPALQQALEGLAAHLDAVMQQARELP
jgi:hypothetical protein